MKCLGKKLLAQEHVNVPDGALSRAQPPGEPTPTDAALSVADTPEEKDHLTASAETSTAEEAPVAKSPVNGLNRPIAGKVSLATSSPGTANNGSPEDEN